MGTLTDVQLDVRELKTNVEKNLEQRFEKYDRRLTSLEHNQRWVALAVIGAVIAAIISFITISKKSKDLFSLLFYFFPMNIYNNFFIPGKSKVFI